MAEEIKRRLREDTGCQRILYDLVFQSHRGHVVLGKSGYINFAPQRIRLGKSRSEGMSKTKSVLDYFRDQGLIELNENEIIIKEKALEYVPKNLGLF